LISSFQFWPDILGHADREQITNSMFYIWHTLIIATFIAVAYWMGYNYGKQKKTTSNKILADTKKD
jgi:hypothetical protein